MATDNSRLPLMLVMPWQGSQPSRHRNGRWMPGLSGNPRGRPTNARLAAKRAAVGRWPDLERAAGYEGLAPEQFVRLARTVFGRWWQGALSRDLDISRRQLIRWAEGDQKISHAREMMLLTVCLRRARAGHALVRAMYRRAAAAERARQELAQIPRHKPLPRR